MKYKPSVVKIGVSYQGVPVGLGAGFFVSEDGELITNRHVIRQAFEKGFAAEFVLASGEKLTDFMISHCEGGMVDVCLLKLNHRTKSYFNVKPVELLVGQDVKVIGHPQGLDFTFSQGILSAVRKVPSGVLPTKGLDPSLDSGASTSSKVSKDLASEVEQIQFSAPISPGNSGGPVFNQKGELLGVATWIRSGAATQNLNFGLSVGELKTFLGKKANFISRSQYVKASSTDKMKASGMIREKLINPIKGKLAKAKSFAEVKDAFDTKYWMEQSLDSPGYTFKILLPSWYRDRCKAFPSDASGSFRMACVDVPMGFGQIFIGIQERSTLKTIMDWDAKIIHQPKPVKAVQDLATTPQWPEFIAKLTDKQRKFLYSFQEQPTKCRDYEGKETPFALYAGAQKCSYMVLNDYYPGGSLAKVVIFHPKKALLIEVAGAADSTEFTQLFAALTQIISMSGEFIEKPGDDRAPASNPLEESDELDLELESEEGP